jgi:hypothetical protein
MFGHGNEIVIAVDPVREEVKSRQEEVRVAASNNGSGLREWIVEEAAWLVAQFTKVALSVAVVRGVHQLFRIGYASESAYQRAPDLWSHGHQEQHRRFGSGAYTGPGNSTWKPAGGGTEGSARGGGSFDQPADHNVPESPRYVTSVDGYHLYLHRKILNPGKQFWPCPLLYMAACETCSFLEYDGGGRPQCVPLIKLRMVLDGTDAGEDMSEIRQWIRQS